MILNDQQVSDIGQSLGLTTSPAGIQPALSGDELNQIGSDLGLNNNLDPWSQFLNTAKNIVRTQGLPDSVVPVLAAQAALESARGNAAPGNNFFGIKGSGNAGSNVLGTSEYGSQGYYKTNSGFAAYSNPVDSINAYLKLILSYKGVPEAIKTGNSDSILRAIYANGYATSPTYVRDVENTPEFSQNYQ